MKRREGKGCEAEKMEEHMNAEGRREVIELER